LMTFSQSGNEAMLQSLSPEQVDMLKKAVQTIESTPVYMFVLGLVERIVALVIQIALSLFVLLGLLQKRYLVYPAAILLHAVIDFMPGLYQAGMIRNVWLIEGMLIVVGVFAFIFIVQSKRMFDQSTSNSTI
ncbi:MAG: YhfC family glutamic-type intramembrane protease, partial [Candidatus Carbobacillus sp.]|nr:YhfC family glutamic-type intramembrane protease [Candidatus Carbobacillus sp.]